MSFVDPSAPQTRFLEKGSSQTARDHNPADGRSASAHYESAKPFETGVAEVGVAEVPTLGEVLRAVVEISRDTEESSSAEELSFTFVATLQELFPGRSFAIRLLGEESQQLDYVYATGKLLRSKRNEVSISTRGLDLYRRHHIASPKGTNALAAIEALTCDQDYETVFEDSIEGFDIPLIDRSKVLGILSVEYSNKHFGAATVPAEDYSLILPVTLHFGAALANKRLLVASLGLREKLERLIEHANTPILVLDLEGRIEVFNRAFANLVALRDAKNERLQHLIYPSDRSTFESAFVQAARDLEPAEVEVVLARGYEPRARVSWNLTPIPGKDDVPESIIAIGRDMSQVRELEKQMLQAEKLATLGQLAAGIVHELNNPLTSISAYAEYLLKVGRKRSAPPEDMHKLERIIESSDRIARFARDLITYARPSPDRPQPVRLRDVIEQAIVFCEHVLAQYEVTVDRNYDTAAPTVLAVQDQIQQLFINLITNACHAMEARSLAWQSESPGSTQAKLFVETLQKEDHLIAHIQDNGAGIPQENLAQIFEPFFSTKTENQGTGLGLSIVRNIVEQHGGTIECKSVLGEGTTFTLTLPLNQPQPAS